jgi:crotonobetainyl-CoA:carnitine CoA-transferase CaiB-like acyl-CoA transferase
LSATLSAAVGDASTYPVEGSEQVTSSRRRLDLSGSGSASRRTKWPVIDGYVEMHLSLGPAAGRFTNNLFKWLGEVGAVEQRFVDLDWVAAPDLYKSGELTFDDLELARAQVAAFFATCTKAYLLEVAIARKLLLAPIYTVEDLLVSPQFIDRRFFASTDDGDGGNLTLPGPLVWVDGEPSGRRERSPRLGEHQSLLASLGEVSFQQTDHQAIRGDSLEVRPALEGLKVADLSWVVAGPMIGRVLADYGATVVRVESSWRVETNRLVGPFRDGVQHAENSASYGNCNAGKLGVTLDLSLQEGRDVVLDLIKWADVVVESFSPGVMEKWGLAFADIQKVNPTVIMVSTSLLGQTGPMANFAGYGNIGAAISGYQNIVGWPDRPPLGPFGPYSDYVGPRFSLVALMAALDRRDREGVGCHLDIAQAESAIHFMAPEIAQFVQQGVVASRRGNRDLQFAPHGVYRCTPGDLGRSRWIAVAVQNDEQWRSLATVMGRPELAHDPKFVTTSARLEYADELDEVMAQWTAPLHAPDVESMLQGAGVAAHVASSSLDLLEDPQLLQRHHFVTLDHPLHGTTTVENSRFVMSRTPAVVRRAAPTLGQDNEFVLLDILGYSHETYKRLMDSNVIR